MGQCNVKGCCKRFSIVRNSLRKERYKARKVHSGESAMALVSSSNEASDTTSRAHAVSGEVDNGI